MKTKDIINISLFTTLLAVCAWISIPTTIPFTMQTFAVFLAMLVLGGKKGTIVIFIYILLGVIGVPVFSGGTAGPGILLGATGGYMIGWIFLGMIVYASERLLIKRMKKAEIISLLVGLLICYFFGTFWFVGIYMGGNTDIGFWSVFSVCVLPFVVPDLVKLTAAYTVSKRLRRILLRS